MSNRTASCSPYRQNPARALAKLVFMAALALGALFACLQLVDEEALSALKHSLNAPTIIGLVLIINLISFVFFLILYAAWQWVRRDLKPPRPEEAYSDKP